MNASWFFGGLQLSAFHAEQAVRLATLLHHLAKILLRLRTFIDLDRPKLWPLHAEHASRFLPMSCGCVRGMLRARRRCRCFEYQGIGCVDLHLRIASEVYILHTPYSLQGDNPDSVYNARMAELGPPPRLPCSGQELI